MAVHIIFRALRSTKYSLVKFTSSQSFIILRVGINSDTCTTKNNRTSYNVVTPQHFPQEKKKNTCQALLTQTQPAHKICIFVTL